MVICMTGDPKPLALSGMVVLDLSQILAGPVCGMMLEPDSGAGAFTGQRPASPVLQPFPIDYSFSVLLI